MSFNFEKIKNLKENSNMIFNLFLKYRINNENSLQFVKKYFEKNKVDNFGVKATSLFHHDMIPNVLKKLHENVDYKKKMEEVISKSIVKDIIENNKCNFSEAKNMFDKLKNTEEVVYIIPRGIVRLMEKDFIDFMNPNIKEFFYNVLLLCLYNIDMEDLECNRVVV